MNRTARWALLGLALFACRAPKTEAISPKIAEPSIPVAPSGPFAPSLVRLKEGAPAHAGKTLADVETCASCHSDVASQWRKSAHAFASFNNPVYRVSVEKLRAERGPKTSQFCGGCHDVALLVDESMMGTVEPTDLRAHAGIACATCHGIAATRPDGNASYDLDTSTIEIPRDEDPPSRARHRLRVGRAALRTAAMCTTCHKAFLDSGSGNENHLIGQDDATPWARSAFAGSNASRVDDVAEQDCRSCHMPRVPSSDDAGAKNGSVASHWFLGGHTWLAAMQDDASLLARAQAFLKDRVSIDLAAVRRGDGKAGITGDRAIGLSAGESVVLDVVLRNLAVGHRFPGGVLDAQDTWIEVVVDDANGKRVAASGADHERVADDAHTLSSYMAREDGTRATSRETHEFRANVWNHTLEPRDAAVIGFGFTAPKAGYPLTVTARLRHRTRTLDMQRAACADTQSERGKAFGVAGLAKVARAIDACKIQPITDIASSRIVISDSAPARAKDTRAVAFERRYAYGLGLSHGLLEHVDEARGPLEEALVMADSSAERARALGVLAQIAAHQGRTEETFEWAAKSDEALHVISPAMQKARADVLVANWRLDDASALVVDVATRSPLDDAAWARAAVTLGGVGDAERALDISVRGLAFQPRDADMLRVQSISLRALHADPKWQGPAESAFLERRVPDDASAIRARCSARVPGCANERLPVHVHSMR